MKDIACKISILLCLLCGTTVQAQNHTDRQPADKLTDDDRQPADTVIADRLDADALTLDPLLGEIQKLDTIVQKKKRDWASWRPDTKRALWLAIVLPGAGQIYNRKYWKLPIFYGGFVGSAYAMRWNNQMYHDYSQAYLDLMDDDPKTESYNQFMHLGAAINSSNLNYYQNLFKKRKDRFRRWRDLSFFVMAGIYGLSIVDAYVDASLSEFDITDDLSLQVAPAVLNNQLSSNPFRASAVGLQCCLNF